MTFLQGSAPVHGLETVGSALASRTSTESGVKLLSQEIVSRLLPCRLSTRRPREHPGELTPSAHLVNI